MIDPYMQYEAKKLAWLANHKEFTHQEYEQAMRKIAEELGI